MYKNEASTTRVEKDEIKFEDYFKKKICAKKVYVDIYKDNGRVLVLRTEEFNVYVQLTEDGFFCIKRNSSHTAITSFPIKEASDFAIISQNNGTFDLSFKIFDLEYRLILLTK